MSPGDVHGTNAVALVGITHAALLREKLRDHVLPSNEDLDGL